MGDRDQQTVWQGFGDGLTQAVEMALLPIVFALIGLFVDRAVGTTPIFTVALAVFGTVGTFLKTYYHYVARVERLEEGKAWRRRA